MKQDVSVIDAHYLRLQAAHIAKDSYEIAKEAEVRVQNAINRRQKSIRDKLMRNASEMVARALKNTESVLHKADQDDESMMQEKLGRLRVTLMIWEIMPMLNSLINWRTEASAHIHKIKAIEKKPFERSERQAACFYMPDSGTAKEVGLKQQMQILDLDHIYHFEAHAEKQRIHLHHLFLQDAGEALSDFDQELEDRHTRIKDNIDESEVRQWDGLLRRREAAAEERRGRNENDPIAKAKFTLMTIHGIADLFLNWIVNRRRDKRRRMEKLIRHFKNVQHDGHTGFFKQCCTLVGKKDFYHWRLLMVWRGTVLVKNEAIHREKARARAYAANQKKLLAEKRAAREKALALKASE